MQRSRGQIWTALLGILAMLSVVFAVPALTAAFPAPGMATIASDGHDMPCEKPCPACPKACADLAGCLVKCFHSIATGTAAIDAQRIDFVDVVRPAVATLLGDRLIPPLLRPPSF